MKVSKYFTSKELECKCNYDHCSKYIINPLLLATLDTIRGVLGKPVIVNSGYRCKSHNSDIGGASKSQHKLGNAADVRCPELGVPLFAGFISLLSDYIRINGIGGKYKTFVHVDVRPLLTNNSWKSYRDSIQNDRWNARQYIDNFCGQKDPNLIIKKVFCDKLDFIMDNQ